MRDAYQIFSELLWGKDGKSAPSGVLGNSYTPPPMSQNRLSQKARRKRARWVNGKGKRAKR